MNSTGWWKRNKPKPGHTCDLSDVPQVWQPVHIANYSMQRSQGTQMLPPGQRWQSLSRRACVQHDPCAPQAQSDLIDISGPAGEFLCLHCPRDAEITKDTRSSAMCKGCQRVLPCRDRESILQLISTSRKNIRSLSERKGWVLNREGLGLLYRISFTSQRSLFG